MSIEVSDLEEEYAHATKMLRRAQDRKKDELIRIRSDAADGAHHNGGGVGEEGQNEGSGGGGNVANNPTTSSCLCASSTIYAVHTFMIVCFI